MTSPSPAPVRATLPQLRECPGCGLLQQVPALEPGTSAYCARCPTILRRVSAHRLDHMAALAIAALVVLAVMCSSSLMSVETAGIRHVADLFSGPEELVRQSMAPLGFVVIFVTVLAPLLRLDRHALRADPRPCSGTRRAICAAFSPWRKGCALGR